MVDSSHTHRCLGEITVTLYHPDVFVPKWYRRPTHSVCLEYSAHAKKASRNDRYGIINLPDTINLSDFQVVEFEAKSGEVIKYVVRGEHDRFHDIVIVFNPEPGNIGFVKTVWLNQISDQHHTLDRSRYSTR